MARTGLEPDDELREMAEATQVLARTVVEELRELLPTPAQWARARALTEAREMWTRALPDDETAAQQIELLALRWSRFIETGVVEP